MSIKQNHLRPPIPPNAVLIDNNNYDTKVVVELDTITGASRIRLEGKQLTKVQIAGVLAQHVSALMQQIAFDEARAIASTIPTKPQTMDGE